LTDRLTDSACVCVTERRRERERDEEWCLVTWPQFEVNNLQMVHKFCSAKSLIHACMTLSLYSMTHFSGNANVKTFPMLLLSYYILQLSQADHVKGYIYYSAVLVKSMVSETSSWWMELLFTDMTVQIHFQMMVSTVHNKFCHWNHTSTLHTHSIQDHAIITIHLYLCIIFKSLCMCI
jgi:hypothetical protein